jgi:Asp-tRNA(Asn)/Glu-tRNA(Gln) amidotransferase A subunit family amidase
MANRGEKIEPAGAHVDACLARIERYEPRLRAFQQHDAARARAEAAAVEANQAALPLAGLALGVKDIVDVAGYGTGCGSSIFANRVADADAASVAQLRAAGAVVMGKTVTTEFAFFSPGPTRNPHDDARTPGGSSSGSAAAVSARFVDAAIGSQTAASITRPASFCGVVGFKPSYGTYSLAGVNGLSPSFDTLGVLARSSATVAAVHAVLASPTPAEAIDTPIAPRRIGICRTPWWDQAEQGTRDAIASAEQLLGAEVQVDQVDLDDYVDAVDLHVAIMGYEAAQALSYERLHHPAQLSAVLRVMLEKGATIGRSEHIANLRQAEAMRQSIAAVTERYDLLIAPAAIGEAPLGLEATGNPVFSRAWTLFRLPTVALPGFTGPAGMPVGVQLLAGIDEDERLLGHALWAEQLFPRLPTPTNYRPE